MQNYQMYKKYEDMYQVFKKNGGRFDESSLQVLVPYNKKPMGTAPKDWYINWLKNKYELDQNLNTITLMSFDMFYQTIKPFVIRDYPEYSLGDNTCLLKHILVYHLLNEEVPIDDENSVELIASGYEWTCPECNQYNKVIEVSTEVTCGTCEKTFQVRDYHHAIE